MKCRDCGQDGFNNVGEVAKHKAAECTGKYIGVMELGPTPDTVAVGGPGLVNVPAPPLPSVAVLPKSVCPPELVYLSPGHVVGLFVMGRLREDGSVEIESVELQR